jgi:hypothetical protein
MKYFVSIWTILAITSVFSQEYWQQKVDYRINISLDDKAHTLNGDIEMDYTNNSPNTLSFIYIHLWPNAYQGKNTALAKQNYKNGNQILYYGNDSLKGNINQLNFQVNGAIAKWSFDEKNPDIAKIELTQALAPGGKIKISTPFGVKIPSGSISRLGHIGQSYQITQWYPKPAVYDKNGWNPYPYLNQGEFYSEFGTYDVSITLPENYVVGSTGDVQNQSEMDFMNELAENTKKNLADMANANRSNDFPPSSEKMKTIRYIQKDVHDFAWFADKRYWVLKDEVVLPASKRKVTTWALFTPKNAELWADASEYIKDGTYYYSLWNGDYPYNHVTAVDGTISAGGGMEYPNVTVIGNTNNKEQLEIVIVHEVGHNWFYGILGTNERDHGWMDEGMNTLNEIRYIQTKYPGNDRLSQMVLGGKFHFNDLDYHDQADFQFQLIAGMGEDQAIETKSPDFTGINYGIVMYQKTGLVFHYLKSYLGDDLFDECMHAYYDMWHFKHPQPEDMKAVFEVTSGKKLDWIFGDLIQTRNHPDYKIKSIKSKGGSTEVTVKNVGQVNGPIPVTLTKDSTSQTIWFEPSDKRRRTLIIDQEFDKAQIDIDNNIPELNRQNNNWHKKGLFGKIEPLKLEFLAGDNESTSSNIFWTPIAAYNRADELMLGILVHNYGIPFKPFQYYAAPMYSINRQMISGLGDFQYKFLPAGCLTQIKIGTGLRSFKLTEEGRSESQYYSAITPYMMFKFRTISKDSPWQSDFQLRGLLKEEVLQPTDKQQSAGGAGIFHFSYSNPNHQWSTELRTEYVQNLTTLAEVNRSMITTEYRYRYLKNKQEKWAEIRLFAGNIWKYSSPNILQSNYRFSLSGADGAQDLFYEQIYFDRQAMAGASHQLRAENMGGFKSASSYGSASTWMVSSNVFIDLPVKISGLGVFADYGAFYNGSKIISTWNTGLGIRIQKVFRVYFPILMEENLASSLDNLNYLQKVRFTFNWQIVNRRVNIKSLL